MRTHISVPENDPTHVVVMPNVLGGSLEAFGPNDGDHAYRADWIAKHTGAVVLAYERPGTGNHLNRGARESVQPKNYPATTAAAGRVLSREIELWGDIPVVFSGASSGGMDILEIARSETVRPDAIGIFDPVGRKKVTTQQGFKLWLDYQRHIESTRPESARNQNPMASPHGWSELNAVVGLARTVREMHAYANAWRTPRSVEHLSHIATAPAFSEVAVNVVFPGKTFTSTQAETKITAANLQDARPDSYTAPFVVTFVPEIYHSWTDDPANFARFTQETTALTTSS